ncbi:MAG: hypothetical protein F6K16_35250 [Symploca sp. SIO2B6]|nr:hypothetical protein [Symploca sp. SIO2B6]
MASVAINLGDAFLIDTPPNGQHLYIAIAPTSESKYLFVNVTTRRSNSDPACILLPGGNVPAFIVRESVIAYRFAREMSSTELASLITPGSPVPKGSCSAAILDRIQQGGLESRRLRGRYKTALSNFLSSST